MELKPCPFCEAKPFGDGLYVCPVCGKPSTIGKPQTNADRIRAMTDEELAFLIGNGCPPACVKPCREYLSVDGDTNCTDCWLDWLKSPVEVDNGT